MKRLLPLVALSFASFLVMGAKPSPQGLPQRVEELEAYQLQAKTQIAELQTQLAAYRSQAERQISELQAQLAAYKSQAELQVAELQTQLAAEANSRIAADTDILSQIDDITLSPNLVALADYIKVVPGFVDGLSGPHVMIEGANLHVRSGSGSTNDNGSPVGLGNLIVGYNEARENVTQEALLDMFGTQACQFFYAFDPYNFDDPSQTPWKRACTDPLESRRTGSHNFVVGSYHNFNSYGGIIGGVLNATDEHAVAASVLGGSGNLVTHPFAMIVGGMSNMGQAYHSSILGGNGNRTYTQFNATKAHAPWPIDEAGWTAGSSAVIGGRGNYAAAWESVIVGGVGNKINDIGQATPLFDDVIVGGQANRITQEDCLGTSCQDTVITGGRFVAASTDGRVEPEDSAFEAIAARLQSGTDGCSETTKNVLDMMSFIPVVGDVFGYLRVGCDVW